MRIFNDTQSGFWDYIKDSIFGGELPEAISKYEKSNSLYLLSGVNRDYIMNYHEKRIRDIDFVIDSKNVISNTTLKTYKGKKNTFGGAKLQINGISVDVWQLKKTWGIIDGNMKPNVESLLKSVFFNCTAIVYDVAKRSFFADDSFYDFLNSRILDIVYENNPNKPLCVVNSFYYKKKYKLKFSERLTNWLIETDKFIDDYEDAEIIHFNKIIFTNKEIKRKINQLQINIDYHGLE